MSTAHANRQTTTCCSCCISLLSFRMGSNYLNDNFFLSLEGIEGGECVEIESNFISLESCCILFLLQEEMSLNWSEPTGNFPVSFQMWIESRGSGKSSTLSRHEQQLIWNRCAVQAIPVQTKQNKNETTIGGLESRPENRENFDAKRCLNLSLSLYSVFISILIVFNDI